jgi:FKBP-type peptidyl-prolyl cis-trans isomerase FkpA
MKCNRIKIWCLVFVVFSSVIIACRDNTEKKAINSRPGKNEMADLNRYLVQKDRERIQNYIDRKNLKMAESSTGLWYQIIKEGTGKNFIDGDKLIIGYECSLLDGTKCYTSEMLGPKEIILGKSEIESGLREGLRMLKPGSEAIFIIPSFLAYGFRGDGKMIPSRAIIVYNVNILQPQ